jgi:hypothetical protein
MGLNPLDLQTSRGDVASGFAVCSSLKFLVIPTVLSYLLRTLCYFCARALGLLRDTAVFVIYFEDSRRASITVQ